MIISHFQVRCLPTLERNISNHFDEKKSKTKRENKILLNIFNLLRNSESFLTKIILAKKQLIKVLYSERALFPSRRKDNVFWERIVTVLCLFDIRLPNR